MAGRAPAAKDFVEVDLRPAGFRRFDVPPVDREKFQAGPRVPAVPPAADGFWATTPITWQV